MAISFQGAGSVWVAVLAAVNLNKFLLEIEITQNLFASKLHRQRIARMSSVYVQTMGYVHLTQYFSRLSNHFDLFKLASASRCMRFSISGMYVSVHTLVSVHTYGYEPTRREKKCKTRTYYSSLVVVYIIPRWHGNVIERGKTSRRHFEAASVLLENDLDHVRSLRWR